MSGGDREIVLGFVGLLLAVPCVWNFTENLSIVCTEFFDLVSIQPQT